SKLGRSGQAGCFFYNTKNKKDSPSLKFHTFTKNF
ncbi:MAG: hypothetical protein ACI9VN_001484, partial [Patescibacteria group bacterium]